MIKVIRYSKQAFRPQIQSHHMEHINYHLHHFNVNEFPEHLRWIIQQRHDELLPFYIEHYEDFKEGIWMFVDGHKENLSLNHLKERVPCFEAEVPEDLECYDCNWEFKTTINDNRILFGGCYVPKRELYKLQNIKRRKFKRTGS